MTNEQIIAVQQVNLQEEGKLSYTGRKLKAVFADGTVIEYPEIEPIHTFQGWKALGYSVKKGEHAIAKFPIWMPSIRRNEEDGTQEMRRMFLKVSSFFSLSQVERREENA